MFANLDDVKRIARITTDDDERDAQLQGALEAVDSYAHTILPPYDEDTVTFKFYEVPPDSYLPLPLEGTVEQIRTTLRGSTRILSLEAFEYNPHRRAVQLRGSSWYNSDPREAGGPSYTYDRVEVDVSYDDGVPAAVRDAVASMATLVWSRGPSTTQGIKSERIGDYSYTLGDVQSLAGGEIKSLLAPFKRRRPVITT